MNNKQENAVKTLRFHFRVLVKVVELLVLVVWLLSSSNYNLFSKIKAFGDFSESLFMWKAILYVAFASIMILKYLEIKYY